MSEKENTFKIPLFNGTGFGNWRFRIEGVLDEKGLLKFIEKDFAEILATGKDEDAKEKLKKSERQCRNIIIQTVHDDQLENIKDKKTAKEMIDSLAKIYERKSIAGQLLLRRQLLTMKYSESDEMSEHLLKFDKKIRELKSSGAKMEDLDIVCHLLLTLPKGYNFLVTAIETMDQDKITVDFVKSRLLDEFNKKNAGTSSEKVTPSAMNANVTCYGCSQVGHIRSQCPENKKKKNNSRKMKNNSEKSSAKNSQANEAQSMTAICEERTPTSINMIKACTGNETATATQTATTAAAHTYIQRRSSAKAIRK